MANGSGSDRRSWIRKDAAMTGTFRYGLYGVGRIGRVHGQIVKEQGHAIAAVGDEVPEPGAGTL